MLLKALESTEGFWRTLRGLYRDLEGSALEGSGGLSGEGRGSEGLLRGLKDCRGL